MKKIEYFNSDDYTVMQCDVITTFMKYNIDYFIEAIETAVQY